jgi:AcrR family transcriptional regulator
MAAGLDMLEPLTVAASPGARRTRANQLEANRAALIRAACRVIGEEGYAKASVVKITTQAGLGQGTFYTYFESRQELFDILLPEVGAEMLEFVRERVSRSQSLVEIEEGSYRSFCEYVSLNPWYGRILFEAETLAPQAARVNAHRVVTQHVTRLTHAWDKGELPDYTLEEIPSLSSVLLALRRHFVRTRMESYQPHLEARTLVEVSCRTIRRMLRPEGRG